MTACTNTIACNTSGQVRGTTTKRVLSLTELFAPLRSLGTAVANELAHLLIHRQASVGTFAEVLADGGFEITRYKGDLCSAKKGTAMVVVQRCGDSLTMGGPGFDLTRLGDQETIVINDLLGVTDSASPR